MIAEDDLSNAIGLGERDMESAGGLRHETIEQRQRGDYRSADQRKEYLRLQIKRDIAQAELRNLLNWRRNARP